MPSLEEQLLSRYAHLDYIFIEGFKREKHPKIAVYRTIEQREIIKGLLPSPIAYCNRFGIVETDGFPIPFDLNDIVALQTLLSKYFGIINFKV